MSTTLGDVVRLSWAVTDASGVAADATVALTITQPDGSTTTIASASIMHAGSGAYSYTFTPTQAGRHIAAWTATGTATDALTDVFEVDSPTTAPILGLADMKRHLNLTRSTTDDAELYDMGRAISDAIEAELGYPVRRRTVVESREGGASTIYLRKAPCSCAVCAPYRLLQVSSVSEYGVPLTVGTDYIFDVDTASLRRGPYGYGLRWLAFKAVDVVVTYTTGYVATPPWVRLAFLRAVANGWQRSQQRPHPGIGQAPMTDEANAGKVPFTLPYHVMALIEPHRVGGF